MRPRKVILCVDDNEQMLSVRTFLLETRGYRVLPANTPAEALALLQAAAPGSIDLLLTDLLMPGMDGNELVRRAKAMHPYLPALIVSGTVAASERAQAADGFLPKGACSPVELLERIRLLVARKRGPKKQLPVPSAPAVYAAIALVPSAPSAASAPGTPGASGTPSAAAATSSAAPENQRIAS